MTSELFAFGGGVILLVLAAIGGGIEVKEIRVPHISPTNRSLSAIAGMILVVLGVYLSPGNPWNDKKDDTPLDSSGVKQVSAINNQQFTTVAFKKAEEKIRLVVIDKLGEGQIREKFDLSINGKIIGSIDVTPMNPIGRIEYDLSAEGVYNYEILGTLRKIWNGDETTLILAGKGKIAVIEGKSFNLHIKKTIDDKVIVELNEDNE
jgi:hypothetical protein